MPTSSDLPTHNDDAQSDLLHLVRQQILNTILYAATVFGLAVLLAEGFSQAMAPQGIQPIFWVLVLLCAVTVFITLSQQVSYQLRAWTLLIITFVLGVFDIARFGFMAEGHIYLFTTVVLSAVLFGDRRTLVVTAICTLTLAGLASAIIQGALPLIPPQSLPLRQSFVSIWLVNILIFILLTTLVNGGVIVLLRRLQQSLYAAQVARSALRISNQFLEERVNERTAALAEAMSEAQQARVTAEEANSLKSIFMANVSHELRTPLNAIINFTYIIRSGLRGPVTPEQIEYLDRVYASGEHLLGMINDILDLSKVEAGRMDLFREPVNLGELVSSTMASAVGLTKEKPITLHQDLAPDLPLVDVDKTRIRQVLLNLLSNAAKFTDAGQITVRVWGEGHELRVSVQDSGLGIAAEKFETIFTEFRQADEGSARSYQGTGLGLPISKRLIALHGGHLWVESQVGVGSTFTFSLPLPLRQAPDPPLSLPLPGTEQAL